MPSNDVSVVLVDGAWLHVHPADHTPMVTVPDAVVDIIVEAAGLFEAQG
jgi:hypothetical protein